MNYSLKPYLFFTLCCLIGMQPVYSHAFAVNSASEIELKYPVLVETISQEHAHKSIWQDQSLREQFENQILLLVLADISDDLAERYQALTEAAEENNWPGYEIIASDLLLFYMSYTQQIPAQGNSWLFGGRINHGIGTPSKASIDAFFNAQSNQQRLEYFQALQPASDQYTQLSQNLFDYYHKNRKKISIPEFTAFAKQGENLEQKTLLLSRLQISGEISLESKAYFEAQGEQLYSPELQNIIQFFQKRHGLKADGIIGANTRFWLNISHQERLRLMALNILRIQLWSVNKPRMVLVNIPNYTMEYWESGKKVFESKVIVGRLTRKTPLFSSKLDSIVFNPTWRVPTRIMRNDILPKALSDNDYFTDHRYDIIPNWRSKDVINPENIAWENITAANFPYKLRQQSGQSNALGLYKFNTPNKNAIYLHDTPAKSLFDKQYRAYSSGCIRVQESKKFAQLLMDKSGFSDQDFLSHHQLPETNVVALKKKITMFTMYQTVWVDEFGFTQFRKDIYNYDKLSKSRNAEKNFYF
ncbi:L,D-transpeptidase family protein [Psychromonas ossibalaenae]|uniref:L,D-transpeptidase family protein n=1 Tax=Psychromonas ossibalaenae TaxID=444922 RepID=UPI000364C714|nr:L,D-transpeptidase family protein [Psychromonas ossibalaenae]